MGLKSHKGTRAAAASIFHRNLNSRQLDVAVHPGEGDNRGLKADTSKIKIPS